METHILVVEDDAEIREGVAIYLPLKSPSAPITGASSAEISMAMLVT